MNQQISEWLDVAAKILLRCWIFGFVLLFIWFGFFMLAPDVIYNLHGSMFDLSPHELNVIHYSGMAFVKLVVICLFFFPWAAITLVLRKRLAESPFAMAEDLTAKDHCHVPEAVLGVVENKS